MSNDFRFLMYQSAEENVSVNAVIKDETIWLSQKGMAELFGCSTDNISLHLKNIFSDGELTKDSVTEKISVTAADGKNYPTQFYNLDAIISVGYNSYGHPSDGTLERLGEAGAEVFRTDRDGTVVFVTDGTHLTAPKR